MFHFSERIFTALLNDLAYHIEPHDLLNFIITSSPGLVFTKRCYYIQHNDTQNDDILHCEIQHERLTYDTQHKLHSA